MVNWCSVHRQGITCNRHQITCNSISTPSRQQQKLELDSAVVASYLVLKARLNYVNYMVILLSFSGLSWVWSCARRWFKTNRHSKTEDSIWKRETKVNKKWEKVNKEKRHNWLVYEVIHQAWVSKRDKKLSLHVFCPLPCDKLFINTCNSLYG